MLRRLLKLGLSSCSFGGVITFLAVILEWNVPFISLPVAHAWQPILAGLKYTLVIALFVTLSTLLYKVAEKFISTSDTLKVKRIQPAESKFLPTYIGLFVIAFGLSDLHLVPMLILISLLFVFWLLLESTAYFNPFMLITGFRFYEVESIKGVIYTIITRKKDIKDIDEFTGLVRLGNYVYLERNK